METLVLGAGALGTASALHLARRGHDVTLVDADGVAARTTGYAAGILSFGVLHDHDRRLVAKTMDGLEALAAAYPAEGAETGPLLRRPGSHLLVGPDARPVADRVEAGIRAIGESCDRLEPEAWGAGWNDKGVVPRTDDIDTVLSIPRDAWTLSTEATQLMARAAKAEGVRITSGKRAEALLVDTESDGGKETPRLAVQGVRWSDGTETAADAVVVALGAWSRPFLAPQGLRLPTQAFRTHAAIVETRHAAAFPILHDDPNGYYLRPEGPRHLLVGNGTRLDPIDPDTAGHEADRTFIEDVATKLPARFPVLEDARMQNAWSGVLTATPDRRPLVGPHPDAEGLFLMTGGNGYGFMRSHALGACLAAAVDGDDHVEGLPSEVLAGLAPDRFWPDPPGRFQAMEGFVLLPEEP